MLFIDARLIRQVLYAQMTNYERDFFWCCIVLLAGSLKCYLSLTAVTLLWKVAQTFFVPDVFW